MSINFEDILSINCAGNTIPEDPYGWDIEPHDRSAETMLHILEARLNNNWCDCETDPYDMLAEPLTDAPGIVHFSIPGTPGLRSGGYAPAKELTAHLGYSPELDKFYYRITGNTIPSRRLLRSIGCIYNRARCFWMCWDYATLEPYVIPDGNAR